MPGPVPQTIRLHRSSAELELVYGTGEQYHLPCEYLRVYSPSAEVRGHGQGEEVLQTGKKYVTIKALNPAGNYAVQIEFSDGHDTGIYSWDYLFELGTHYEQKWADYLNRLETEGGSREPVSDPIIFKG